jgi:hypothetical protein
MSTPSDLISARREYVLQSYNSARADNHYLFLKGDDKATSEYIFPNQIEDANNIVDIFYRNNRRVVSIQKKTKVGADGLMIEIAKLLTTHNDDNFVINPANVKIITGMSNASWQKDMIDKSPSCFKGNIFHHGKLSKSDLKNHKNGLIIIDEIDSGDKEGQVLHKTLKEAGILDVHHMQTFNNRFVFISATMIKELYDLYRWGDLHVQYKMTIPSLYIGHKDFLEKNILQEFFSLNTRENVKRWVSEDIINMYGTDYRVHIVRVNLKNIRTIQETCKDMGISFRNHTSDDRLTDAEINEFFTEPLRKHIVFGVKGFFRRANLIPNRWKLRIGATHELYTKKIDNSVQVQGLPGRMTGYWRNEIDGGHKTGPHRTSLRAINEYESIYNDPFGYNSYKTMGFKKRKGKVTEYKATMLKAENVNVMNPVSFPEIDTHPEYDITEPYDEKEELRNYLKPRICGKTTAYKLKPSSTTPSDIKDFSIIYRDELIPLYLYETKQSFKNKDIYCGINKETATDKIGARIMPVIYSNSVKWVGIYLRAAFNEDIITS